MAPNDGADGADKHITFAEPERVRDQTHNHDETEGRSSCSDDEYQRPVEVRLH